MVTEDSLIGVDGPLDVTCKGFCPEGDFLKPASPSCRKLCGYKCSGYAFFFLIGDLLMSICANLSSKYSIPSDIFLSIHSLKKTLELSEAKRFQIKDIVDKLERTLPLEGLSYFTSLLDNKML